MTQRDRDRLVVLKKSQKKLITQVQAAGELQVSERQVRRLLGKVKDQGDRGVIHGLRGRASNGRSRLTTLTENCVSEILSNRENICAFSVFFPRFPSRR